MGRLRKLLKKNRAAMNVLAKIVLLIASFILIGLGLDIIIDPAVVILTTPILEHIAAGTFISVGIANVIALFLEKYVDTVSYALVGAIWFFAVFRIVVVWFNPISIMFLFGFAIVVLAAKIFLKITA